MLDTLIRIDQSISPASTEVTYRFKRKTEDSKLDLSNLPSTGMQQVIKSSEDSATVKVVVSSAARQSAAEPLSDDMRKRYLAASSLVNYEDPEIQELAKRAAGDEKDPARLANKLCDFVADYIEDKNLSVGFASASEVARSKEGDCTEHGILLAALGRAHGIPTRLVTGIVYVNHFGHHRDVFVGHLWAQFWLEGRWVDLDAALDENPVKPTHIALSLSDAQDTALVDMVSSIWLHLNQFDLSVVDQKSGSASQPAASKPADR
jgi:transglutaminase-like putative cysteine protease